MGRGVHPSHCNLELQEKLRPMALIIAIVRRIRVDENMHTGLPVPRDIDLISVHMASSFS